jgi:hypothetical protein
MLKCLHILYDCTWRYICRRRGGCFNVLGIRMNEAIVGQPILAAAAFLGGPAGWRPPEFAPMHN